MHKKLVQGKNNLNETVKSERENEQLANADRFFSLSSSLLCIAGFDGYFKHLSIAWERVLGYSLDDLLSKPYMAFVHPDDIEPTQAEAGRLADEGLETITFVNRYRCNNGDYRWLQWNVTPEKEKALLYCVAHDITPLKTIRSALQESTHQLSERIKELNCLYRVSNFFSNQEITLEAAFQGILNQIPSSWQYPEIVCARIILHGNAFQTNNFRKTIWKQASDIIAGKKKIGVFEVYYLKEMPEKDEGPFLKEKRYLLNAISEMTGEFCTHSDAVNALRQSEEQYRILAEHTAQKEADSLRREYAKLKSTLKDRYRFGNIIGKSPAMQEIYELITEASATDSPVVVLGESGTGKEEVSRTIHNISRRRHKGFVPVNCGAIPEPLFESEFFGYKKGAFTGAFVDKHGFLDLSHQGTLFLDEVSELNLNMQVKLLRVLESGEYTPIGNNAARQADIRIISATNKDLMSQIKKKQLREDFYYRIHVIPILLPPLRDRKEDIPLLVENFLQKYGGSGNDLKFSGKEMDQLCDYPWPGNIRELQNVVQRYMVAKNLDYLSAGIARQEKDLRYDFKELDGPDFRAAIRNHERRIIMEALGKNRWHKEKTASMLGLPKRTFFRKLEKLGLTRVS